MTYYLAPAAFLFNKLQIFFFIINLILIGMIIGMSLVCILIFPYIQKLFIHIICLLVKFDRKLKPLIMKNITESHSSRNAKTSILFTICLAYLIFGGSSLLLLGDMIVSFVKSTVGSDIYVSTMVGEKNLPENEIRDFLFAENIKEDPLILDYSFGGRSIYAFLRNATGSKYYFKVSNGGTYPRNGIKLKPVEINYLNSSFIDYYTPIDLQKGVNYPRTQGKKDVIWSLYSDEGTTDMEGGLDKYFLNSRNLTKKSNDDENVFDLMKQIRVVLPEGITKPLSTYGGGELKLRISSNKREYFKMLVRGLPRKVPGYTFMSYSQVQFFLTGLVSFDQAIDISRRYIKKENEPYLASKIEEYQACKHHACRESGLCQEYQFTSFCDNSFYPKDRLRIRISSRATREDRQYIANQLRGILQDNLMLVVDVGELEDNVATTLSLFQVFIILIGIIGK